MIISEARLTKILTRPVVSEKSALANEKNTFVFKVLPDATKDEIKAAVKMFFGAEPIEVRTMNYQGKSRRTVHGIGRRSDWKKAYVVMDPSFNIESVGVAGAEKGE